MSKPIQITVGGSGQYDPAIGATTYSNPDLKGLTYYVEKSTVGTIPESNYSVLTAGGFGYPSAFGAGEIYFIHLTGVDYQAAETGYSNGFNVQKVLSAMVGRLGWRQPVQTNLQVLNSINQSSTSGRYFNDFHPLVTLKNVKENIEDETISDLQLNAYLENLQRSTILGCLNRIFNKPEIVEQAIVYERCGRQNDVVIPNTGLCVGYEIEIAEDYGLSAKIDAITLFFNDDKTFTLYLYQDGKKSPIWSKEVTVEAYERTIIEIDDLVLSYAERKANKFFLCYYQNDLDTCQAVRDTSVEFEDTNCFEAEPFYSVIDTVFGFKRSNYSNTNIPYGLNFEVTVFRDHTQNIIRKAYLFDEAIGLQMAINVIDTIINSTRSNSTQRITGENANKLFSELNQAQPSQDFPFMPGLKAKYNQTLKTISAGFFPKNKSVVVNLLCDD